VHEIKAAIRYLRANASRYGYDAGRIGILGVHTGELHAEHLETFSAVVDDLAAGRIDVEQARSRIASRI
jgi:hypothetical protein